MAVEPEHLVGFVKVCPRCSSLNVKFAYANNYNALQARYLCESCRIFFEFGGMLRAVKQPSIQVGDPNADCRSRITRRKPVEAPVGERRSARKAAGAKAKPVQMLPEIRPAVSGASPAAGGSVASVAIPHGKEADRLVTFAF